MLGRLFVILLLAALPASAQITFVQSKACNFTTTDPNACTFDSSVTAGNLIVTAYIDHNNRTIDGISDTLTNTYSVGHFKSCNGTNPCLHTRYTISGSSGANTVTWNLSGTSTGHIVMMEFSGIAASPLDQVDTPATGTGSPETSGTTGTTVQADELIVGVLGLGSAATITQGASFTGQVVSTGDERASMEYKIVSSTGTYNADWTSTGSPAWVATVETFKAAAVSSAARRRII